MFGSSSTTSTCGIRSLAVIFSRTILPVAARTILVVPPSCPARERCCLPRGHLLTCPAPGPWTLLPPVGPTSSLAHLGPSAPPPPAGPIPREAVLAPPCGRGPQISAC